MDPSVLESSTGESTVNKGVGASLVTKGLLGNLGADAPITSGTSRTQILSEGDQDFDTQVNTGETL